MNDIVIRAEGLGKKYLIGHQAEGERYTALRDVIARSARGLARSAADLARGRPLIAGDEVEEFWALRDVSFEVRRGEVVGIIGRNGAGKSTLLKVLSRITEPSAGRVTVRGRVASLLEVGTGFHPELTGRENIYLNGAILGMTRAEIRARFDAIVAFAEVERFLDTPVKRYSSGMYVRLAFAVAAHLEPEILVVDEVLAVGDAEFQRKCLGKMGEVASGGRTVLFVSHNLTSIVNLCSVGMVLQGGRKTAQGSIDHVVELYSQDRSSPSTEKTGKHLVSAAVLPPDGDPNIAMGGAFKLRIEMCTPHVTSRPNVGVVIRQLPSYNAAFGFNTEMLGTLPTSTPGRRFALEFLISSVPLLAGRYSVGLTLRSDRTALERVEDACAFDVTPVDVYGTGTIPYPHGGPMFAAVDVNITATQP